MSDNVPLAKSHDHHQRQGQEKGAPSQMSQGTVVGTGAGGRVAIRGSLRSPSKETNPVKIRTLGIAETNKKTRDI